MKKIKIAIIAAAVLWVAGYLTFSNISDIPHSSLDQQAVSVLDGAGCILCHSKDSKLPFYAHLPIVGSLVNSDVASGLKYFDISPTIDNAKQNLPANETALSKIEYVVKNGTMPPFRFTIMHWGSKLTSDEKEVLLAWIASERKELNAGSGIAEKFKNEPVWPVTLPKGLDSRKIKLGSILYHHTALSGDETVSCATCHPLDKGGVDGLQTSTGIRKQKGDVNAPTVYNAVFNHRQFWDGRADDLQSQAGGPPMNPVEMDGGDWDKVAKRLEKDSEFAKAFKEVYPDGFTEKNITDAIATFEATLVTVDSDFDLYLKGNESALSPEAKKGYEEFKKAGCSVCHAGRNLGGQTFEYMGLKGDYFKSRGNVGKINDNGLLSFTKDDRDVHKFKTPTLRNVELTAPYFHDGSVSSLKEAVEIMSKFQTDKKLTDEQIDNLVKFLESLTGKVGGKKLEKK